MTDTYENLGEALPREMARIRDRVMPIYRDLGTPGRFALTMMGADLDRAARAMVEGDVVEMLKVYDDLKDYQL